LPLPAGIGDVLTGVRAIPAAIHVARQGRYWRGVGIAWNVLGIADLITGDRLRNAGIGWEAA
jgi:hypothetical protein